METKFASLSLFQFKELFQTEHQCQSFLANLKWKDGYSCPVCSHGRYCKGIKTFDRQCTRCSHLESPTAGTLFHKVKFPLVKAFWIIYFISTNKKGMSSTEMSRTLGLRQKTCWLFKQKAMQAMESSNRHPLEGKVEVEKFEIGYRSDNSKNPRTNTRKTIVIAIEKKSKGVARIYARQITESTRNNYRNFIDSKISKDAEIIVSRKSHFVRLELEQDNITLKDPKKNKSFDLMRRIIHNLNAWFKGVHGHAKHLQYYLNEYCYRYNRHRMKGEIFDDLITRMVRHKPAPYKLIVG